MSSNMLSRADMQLAGLINQQRCVTLALAAIVAAMAKKTSVTPDEARNMIRSCHIYGEDVAKQTEIVEAVEKIIGEILKTV